MRGGRVTVAAMIVCLLALAVLPFVADKFTVQFVTKMMIMAIFAMSLDLLVGYAGLVSLGHAAFFGVEGYAVALLSPKYQAARLWLTLPAARIISPALRLSVGLRRRRTSGLFLIMVTLPFGQL